MKLSTGAVIATDKLTRYLLVPQTRGDKSAFLAGAGYTINNADQLLRDLREQILPLDATALESNQFRPILRGSRAADRPQRGRLGSPYHLDDRALVRHHEVRYTHSRQMRNR